MTSSIPERCLQLNLRAFTVSLLEEQFIRDLHTCSMGFNDKGREQQWFFRCDDLRLVYGIIHELIELDCSFDLWHTFTPEYVRGPKAGRASP